MFGREYARHLDLLTQSFAGINKQYSKKIKIKNGAFTEKLKEIYISIFGIPEIGFQLRVLYFGRIISQLKKKYFKKILDAGCGIGMYSFILAEIFSKAQIKGIDIDKDKLKSCENISDELKIKNTRFAYSDILKLHKSNYDLIINVDVLEHIDNYELVLKNFYNVLNKKGYLYIHVPQSNQQRIFGIFRTWHHEDHIREGISKLELENKLKKLGFKVVVSRETFGIIGKLSWELNHITLSRSFVLAGVIFPFLYILALLDLLFKNKNGLGIAILAQK